MTKDDHTEGLREQLEEFALHLKSGTTKGKHRTAVFDTVELTKLVAALQQAHTTAVLQELMEKLLEKQFWAADDAYDAGDVVSVNDVRTLIKDTMDNMKGEKHV